MYSLNELSPGSRNPSQFQVTSHSTRTPPSLDRPTVTEIRVAMEGSSGATFHASRIPTRQRSHESRLGTETPKGEHLFPDIVYRAYFRNRARTRV
jgi:hypothetical protein